MRVRGLGWMVVLAIGPITASTAGGLVAPAADTLWPQWRARISMQTSELQPLSLSRLMDGGSRTGSWQGGALLGDYTFASPSFGSFRASGGLMFGATGGAPLLSAAAGTRLGLTVQTSTGPSQVQGAAGDPVPYLGLGFTSSTLGRSLSLSADMGLVAGHPSSIGDMGRALFGNQGREQAWRELRVSPVLQVGLRYTF